MTSRKPNFNKPFLCYLKKKLPLTRKTKSGISYTIFLNDKKFLCIKSQFPLAEITKEPKDGLSIGNPESITTTFNNGEYTYTSGIRLT